MKNIIINIIVAAVVVWPVGLVCLFGVNVKLTIQQFYLYTKAIYEETMAYYVR